MSRSSQPGAEGPAAAAGLSRPKIPIMTEHVGGLRAERERHAAEARSTVLAQFHGDPDKLEILDPTSSRASVQRVGK